MSLTGCVTVATPSEQYLKDCHISYLDGEVGTTSTNAAVVKLAEDREFDLRMCNVSKAAIRMWFDTQCKGWLARCKAPGQ